MITYLLTWNPNKWVWDNIEQAKSEIDSTGSYIDSWSCGGTKSIRRGDRVFLMRLGRYPKGIIASGWAQDGWYKSVHWDLKKRQQGIRANYINVDFDIILNSDKENILEYDELQQGILKNMHWFSQSSGISIPNDIANILEKKWSDFNKDRNVFSSRTETLTEEIINPDRYFEGAIKTIKVNGYERNSRARQECIDYYGYDCYCCGINLECMYGGIAKNFIHVHHLVPLADIKKKYELNPVKDLRPVCPNCHAVIHRYEQVLTIDELKNLIEKQKYGKD